MEQRSLTSAASCTRFANTGSPCGRPPKKLATANVSRSVITSSGSARGLSRHSARLRAPPCLRLVFTKASFSVVAHDVLRKALPQQGAACTRPAIRSRTNDALASTRRVRNRKGAIDKLFFFSVFLSQCRLLKA